MNININTSHVQRISAHSHIKDLGSLVGQEVAREAASISLELIKEQKLAGRSILLAGPVGSGKTAIALGMSKELGQVPFVDVSASQVYSSECKKTEQLTMLMRQAIGLKIREIKEVYEGQVMQYDVIEEEDPLTGYTKTISNVLLTLRTQKGSKQMKLDPSIYEQLQKERVVVGDVIYLEANSGIVKRVGRSDQFANEYDLEAEEYVPLPKGEVHKKKEVVQTVTLHDLDMSNANPNIKSELLNRKKTEITEKLRNEINKVVNKYIDQGIAELLPGVLFIDECHMLDIECFAFLNKALESPIAPIMVFATNRGMATVRGTDMQSPHGVPTDFLDRLLIIKTIPLNINEIKQILTIRAKTEGIVLKEDDLNKLSQIGVKTSLRYATQLLTPLVTMRQVEGVDVEFQDAMNPVEVEEVTDLFIDAKTSAELLEKEQGFIC